MSSRYKMLVGQGLISVLFVTLASIPTSIGFLETYFYVIPPKGTISVIDSTRNGTVILQVEDQAAVVEYNDEIYPEIKGNLIISYPNDACTPVNPPPALTSKYFDLDSEGSAEFMPSVPNRQNRKQGSMEWILLAKKSNCAYTTKIDYADAAGYGALIIYNIESNETEVIGLTNGNPQLDLRIPSFFIGEYDGLTLKHLFDQDTQHRLYIIIETTSPIYKDIAYYLLWVTFGVFFVIVGLCILKPVYDCALHPWIQRRHRRRRRMLLTARVRSMPVLEWNPGLLEKYETCVICMERYVGHDLLRILPCHHGYHINCIDAWLLKVRRVCPVCKEKIIYSSCWETLSDSDISEGNYFTDSAYEPLHSGLTEGFDPRDFVDIPESENPGREGSGTASHLTTPTDICSLGSGSLGGNVKSLSTMGLASSFVSCTVSVHPREGRRASDSSRSVQDQDLEDQLIEF